MNMFCIRWIYIFGFFFLGLTIKAQEGFVILHEPEFSLNHKFSDNYKANLGFAARHFVFKKNDIFFKNRQVQVSHFSTWSLSYNNSISFGIMYRNREWFDDSNNELRLTQQFNYTKQQNSIRFGHRFRNEQRIFNHSTIHRLRYRFALDAPLQGEKLDLGETYIVANTEFLLSLNASEKPAIDNRITSQIGWQTSEHLKLQIGLQYRFESFNLDTQNILLVLTSVVLKI